MALLGTALASEIGLRLLLSPPASTIVFRTACTVVGVGVPVYSTFRAIERKDSKEQEQWLVYWAAFGCFSVAEIFSDTLLSWFPLYYHAKFAILVWLQLPNNYGARTFYIRVLRPILLKHQTRLDRLIDGTRSDVNKMIARHQPEIQAVKRTVRKVAVAVYRATEEAIQVVRQPEAFPEPEPSCEQGEASPGPQPRRGRGEASPGAASQSEESEDPGWVEVPRDVSR